MKIRITGEYSKQELEREIASVIAMEASLGNYCKDIKYTVTPAKILGRSGEVEDTAEFYHSALLIFESETK